MILIWQNKTIWEEVSEIKDNVGHSFKQCASQMLASCEDFTSLLFIVLSCSFYDTVFAVAFYGSSTHPQLVALVAQDEIVSASGQIEPPGMHMIYLPYSDDIRPVEELHTDTNPMAPRATEDQVQSASSLVKRVDLKNFSVCQFANPALQRHYAVLQALALDEDEMPDTKDETLPDEEGLASEASKKRKAIAENATKEYANYDWLDLADNGKLKELTVVELKYYLTRHNLPVTGKKEALISRILTHMGNHEPFYLTKASKRNNRVQMAAE
ncbi:UNVERIFIED_CONTAM: ATP-dependent DNA helicase 2 subunit KU70 [Sesamum angustifolium]|uniref:ATP-dependent DNA helicase 2 subunit KU70 n=1 Tax=Sesamum angustifolium TaxID=2727405 RepID=A0AAW2LTL3_9LAMI